MEMKSLRITAIVFSVILVLLTAYILINGYYASKNEIATPNLTPTPTVTITSTPTPAPTSTPKATGSLDNRWDESVQGGGQWTVYTSRNVYALKFNSDGTAEKASYAPSNSAEITANSTNDALFEFAMNGTPREGSYTIKENKITFKLKSGAVYSYTYDKKTNTIKATDGTVYVFVE